MPRETAQDGNHTRSDLIDAAMLYWLEVPHADAASPPPGTTASFARFRADAPVEAAPVPLAVTFGTRRYRTPAGLGDYFRGAFFYLDARPERVFFLAQWPETEAGGAYLHYRVVSMGREET
jgi:hypothetical protein